MVNQFKSRAAIGIVWMVVTGLLFVLATALVKYLDSELPAVQAAFLRYGLGLFLFLPMVLSWKDWQIETRHFPFIILRGVSQSLSVCFWFFAMTRIPLADLTAIGYMAPIFVTAGAVLFLRERLTAIRLVALGIAMTGAIIILRPGFREIEAGYFAMIIATIAFAGSSLLGKQLSEALPVKVIVVFLSVTVTTILLPVALVVWMPPSGFELLIFFLVACFSTLGQFTLIMAFKATSISITQPFAFLQLVWATILGIFVFGEQLDPFVIIGGFIIIGSVTILALHK